MILAGVFGVLSAVFVEEDIHLSNDLNICSVSFYLLEALTLFGSHKRGAVTFDVGNLGRGLLLFGDLCFVVGALLDVIVRFPLCGPFLSNLARQVQC